MYVKLITVSTFCHVQGSVLEEERAIELLDQKILEMEREITRDRKSMGGCVWCM